MATDAADALESGRERFAGRAWMKAYELLARADSETRLFGADLELLATSAYMVGRESEYLEVLERCYGRHLESGDRLPAARCGFWVALNLARAGEAGQANGWLGRTRRLLEGEEECVERGYLLLPEIFEHEARGDWAAAGAVAAEAQSIGERLGDMDLAALAGHERGHTLIRRGLVRDGVARLDEAMLAAIGGELSPIVTGIVYCGVILACERAQDISRAREWTAQLADWCDAQPEMVAFTGRCLIHRAEIKQLGGEWPAALAEARRAAARSLRGENRAAAGEAIYREAELQRLVGDLAGADSSYRAASEHGYDPQPGLALLRLDQGERDTAEATIRRALQEAEDAAERCVLLPAFAEIMVAIGDLDAAETACRELAELAGSFESDAVQAAADRARGAIDLGRGSPQTALSALRRAARSWQKLAAPYEAARAREMIGRACGELGDDEAAELELRAARSAYAALGATPDLARIESSAEDPEAPGHDLTVREMEVLKLVASGQSNRQIADRLVISEHTVARHLQNIYAKLGVSSRTAASALAFERNLL